MKDCEMPDLEKVIDGLCAAIGMIHGYVPKKLWANGYEVQACRDAIALLKEQEAVEPEVKVLNEIDRIYRCPKCHKAFFYRKQKYCDLCGKAVKWDG